MNLKTAMAASTVIGLTMTACAVPTAQPTVTVTASAAVPPPSPAQVDSGTDSSADAQYIRLMRRKPNTYVDTATDAQLIELGHKACGVFDSGTTVREYAEYFVSKYPNDAEMRTFAAYIAGAAIASYCPEYQPQVDAL